MNARERVLTVLSHRPADRVPLDFWATPEVWEKLYRHFDTTDSDALLNALHVDIREVQPDYHGAAPVPLPDGSYYDRLHVHRKKVKNAYSTYEEYASAPLKDAQTPQDIDAYNWPDPEDYDYSSLHQKIDKYAGEYYIKLSVWGLFEYAWPLRGYEQFMMDMALKPEIAHRIMEHVTDYNCRFIEKALNAAGDQIDLVYTYDDVAAQNGFLMSRQMYREFIWPYHQKLNRLIKKYNKTIMYHSCGAIFDLIDDFVESGIDILNPLQPLAKGMDFQRIKDRYGSILCFHGGIDIQHLLPHGTPDQVRQTVRRTIDILGKNGGYILTSAHYIQADTPLENILALYDEAYRYRPESEMGLANKAE